MKSIIKFTWLFCLPGLLLLASCNYPGRAPGSSPQARFTQAAQTVAAQLASTSAPGESGTGSPLPVNTDMARPTLTPMILPTATSTPTLMPTPTESLELAFSDDFSQEGNWYTEQGDNYGFEYSAAGYRIYADIQHAEIWTIRDKVYRDVVLEVEAARMAGAKSGYFGLICRQVDQDHYYALVIASDGFFGFGKVEGGDLSFLQEGKDTAGIINPDAGAVNKIRADCSGDLLRLYVNGKLLGEFQDTSYQKGNTGLIIGTRSQPELEVLFDNFATYQQPH